MSVYYHRFEKVVSYIEQHLDTNIDVDSLCDHVHLSKFHFHRQCSAYFGISVAKLIRLLRLKKAAFQLAYRVEERILDIALMNGYNSHEAFSRTFKKYFLKSPSSFRQSPDWGPWHFHYEPVLKLRTDTMYNSKDFTVNLIEVNETLIAVKEHRGTPRLLGQSIRQFIEWRKAHKLSPSKSKTYNLVYDDPTITAPEDYRFDICCAIDTPVAANSYKIVNKVIPAGVCAVLRHNGSDDTIGNAVNYLYNQWLPDSGRELRDFPLYFERVSFFPDVSENNVITDIFLPIE